MSSRRDPLSVRVACALYRAALRLLIDAERRVLAPQMIQTFRALALRQRQRSSPLSVFGLAIAEAFDTVRSRRRDPSKAATPSSRGRRRAPLDALAADIRTGVRVLRRRPGFTIAALATLAVGVGSSTAIFAVVDNLLIRPLPYPDADRMVELWSWNHADNNSVPSLSAELREAWAATDLFDAVATFDGKRQVLVGDGEPVQIQVTGLSPGLIQKLGARPALGRVLNAADYAADANAVVMLSDGLWRRRFGRATGVVGDTLRIDDQTYEIVGVMPPEFAFPDRGSEVWMPMARDAAGWAIAWLAPGIDIETARERAGVIATSFQEEGLAQPGWGIELFDVRDSLIYSVGDNNERTLWIMFAAVSLLLLISAANVTGLTLSQTASRRRELAVRTALGAGRGRIIRQLLVEGSLLALTGAVLGAVLAMPAVRLAVAAAPERLSFLSARPIFVDVRVIGFAFAAGLAATLLFAALPALQAARSKRLQPHADGRAATEDKRQRRLRRALVVAEVAIAAVLLAGAGLLVRSMGELLRIDPGFDTEVTVVAVSPSRDRYPDSASQWLFVERLHELGASLPGVETAAVTNGAPPQLGSFSSVNRAVAEGQPPPEGVPQNVENPTAADIEFLNVINVTDDYFRAMGIDLLDGRAFEPIDTAADVAIISEDFARRFWHGTSPIGRRLRLREGQPWLTVVGVVEDVQQTGLDDDSDRFEIYYPMAQSRPGYPRLFLVLRGDLAAESLMPPLRAGLQEIDPQLPFGSLATMEEILSDDLAGPRFTMGVMVSFAGVAMMLSAIGIYGMLAYDVVQRRREIGIRVALGAQRGNVLGGVVGAGMAFAATGLTIGLAGAWALTRFMRSLLFEVEPLDPAALVATTALLGAIALAACAVPALRATRVDPMAALRDS